MCDGIGDKLTEERREREREAECSDGMEVTVRVTADGRGEGGRETVRS